MLVQYFLSLSPGRSVNLALQRGTEEDVVGETVMFNTKAMTFEMWFNEFNGSREYDKYVFRLVIAENCEPSLDINVKYGSNE